MILDKDPEVPPLVLGEGDFPPEARGQERASGKILTEPLPHGTIHATVIHQGRATGGK